MYNCTLIRSNVSSLLKYSSRSNLASLSTLRGIPCRDDAIKRLKSGEEFDVLIVGGGSTGVGCALDAQTRGLKVALIERNDFSSGTSSRSTKLLHGGIRYMQNAFLDNLFKLNFSGFKGNMSLVMNALRERNHLLRTAPHLTNWIPIMVPFYDWIRWPHSLLVGGMKLYDALAYFPRHSFMMSPKTVFKKFPMIKQENLKYAAVFWEGQQNDSRTALTIAMTAAKHGAAMCNYTEGIEIVKEGERVSGMIVMDKETGDSIHVKAKSVIFAGGPYTDGMRMLENKDHPSIISGAGGTHIVVPNYYAPKDMGLADMATSDGRILFFLPWQDHTIIGTTDTASEIKDWPSPIEDEIQWILNEVEKYLSPDLKVRRSDVLSAWNGIRPLVSDPSALDTASVSRDHTIISNKVTGTITICGGKWTTYREMAEDAVDAMLDLHPSLKSIAKPCQTLTTLLVGAKGYTPMLSIKLTQKFGFTKNVAEHLAKTYGTRAYDVGRLAAPTKEQWPTVGERIVPGYPFLEAEVKYACDEYARTIVDIIAHRTRLAFLNVERAKEAIPVVAKLMKSELQWDEKRVESEIKAAHDFLSTFGGPIPNKGQAMIRAATRRDLLDKFRAIDINKSGTLDKSEVSTMIEELGFPMNESNVEGAMKDMDQDQDGEVTFDEFVGWWNSENESEITSKLKDTIGKSNQSAGLL